MRKKVILLLLFGMFKTSQINAQSIICCDDGGLCFESLPNMRTCEQVSKEEKARMGPYSGEANCYAYAFKLEYIPCRGDVKDRCLSTSFAGKPGQYFETKPQPGEFSSSKSFFIDLSGPTKDVKERMFVAVSKDAERLGLVFREVSGNDHKPKAGNWLVALAYYDENGESDYHWWRKNWDGRWSHKPGSAPIMCLDSREKEITDPQFCNRGNYNVFLGYYEVGPVN